MSWLLSLPPNVGGPGWIKDIFTVDVKVTGVRDVERTVLGNGVDPIKETLRVRHVATAANAVRRPEPCERLIPPSRRPDPGVEEERTHRSTRLC